MAHPVILASRSKARIEMLQSAGLKFKSIPADINEEEILRDLEKNNKSAKEIAANLAKVKALHIAQQNPNCLVIGSDQILYFDGQILQKAKSENQAIKRLQDMQNKSHDLISSVTIALNDQIVFESTDQVTLKMGSFDQNFWDHYKSGAAPALTSSVGGYWFEDIGAWLFTKINGNIHTLLGMPLLPLLQFLRDQYNIIWSKS